jgi:hypothetical protein
LLVDSVFETQHSNPGYLQKRKSPFSVLLQDAIDLIHTSSPTQHRKEQVA